MTILAITGAILAITGALAAAGAVAMREARRPVPRPVTVRVRDRRP